MRLGSEGKRRMGNSEKNKIKTEKGKGKEGMEKRFKNETLHSTRHDTAHLMTQHSTAHAMTHHGRREIEIDR